MMTETGVRFRIPQHWRSALVAIENFDTSVNQGWGIQSCCLAMASFPCLSGYSYPGYADLIPEIGEWNASASELKKREQFAFSRFRPAG